MNYLITYYFNQGERFLGKFGYSTQAPTLIPVERELVRWNYWYGTVSRREWDVYDDTISVDIMVEVE